MLNKNKTETPIRVRETIVAIAYTDIKNPACKMIITLRTEEEGSGVRGEGGRGGGEGGYSHSRQDEDGERKRRNMTRRTRKRNKAPKQEHLQPRR